MAKTTATQHLLLGVGALVVGYLAYGEYKKYQLQQAVRNAALGKPGSAIQVLETLSTQSPTKGAGSKTVTVPVDPVDPDHTPLWFE